MDITILDYQLTQDYQYSLQVKTTESAQWEQKTTIRRWQRQACRTAPGSMEVPTKHRMWTGMEYTIPENGYFTYDFQGEGSSALWNLYLYDENMNRC